MFQQPTISVILPTLNEERSLSRALDSVAEAEERIVADGGSQDGTIPVAQAAGCKVLEGPPGRGRQLRAGAEAAMGDVLLFLHADCWLAEGGLGLRAHAQHDARVFGAFEQRIDDSRWRFRFLEYGNALRAKWLGLPYGDQAVFVDRRTYAQVGGFRAEPLMEDVMLARAVRRCIAPVLLAGPIHVSARRWQRRGVMRQTICNWFLLGAFYSGVSTTHLARWYR